MNYSHIIRTINGYEIKLPMAINFLIEDLIVDDLKCILDSPARIILYNEIYQIEQILDHVKIKKDNLIIGIENDKIYIKEDQLIKYYEIKNNNLVIIS